MNPHTSLKKSLTSPAVRRRPPPPPPPPPERRQPFTTHPKLRRTKKKKSTSRVLKEKSTFHSDRRDPLTPSDDPRFYGYGFVAEETTNKLLSSEFQYEHRFRQCLYRDERLYVSPNEKKMVQHAIQSSDRNTSSDAEHNDDLKTGWQRWSALFEASRNSNSSRKLIIDTDIGTDCDDALALLTCLNMPACDVELVGVTTCYHPTRLRKYVAKAILNAAGGHFADIPVIAGPSRLCGTHRDFFLQGNEGEGLGLSQERLENLWREEDGADAIDFLYKAVCDAPRQISIAAIGTGTNIGLCMRRHPDFAKKVAHIVFMGGGNMLTQKHWEERWDRSYIETGPNAPHIPLPRDADMAQKWLGGVTNFSVEKEHMTCVAGNVDGKKRSHDGSETLGNSSSSISSSIQIAEQDTNIEESQLAPKNSDKKQLDQAHRPIVLLPNINVSNDTLASKWMVECTDCPITVIPHFVTAQNWVKGRPIETLLKLSKLYQTNDEDHQFRRGLTKNKLRAAMKDKNRVPIGPITTPALEASCLTGKLVAEWFKTRNGQRGQCPHDPLTIFEAVYPHPAAPDSTPNFGARTGVNSTVRHSSCLHYIHGTFVCHSWAGFITFIPAESGPHRLAAACIDASKWTEEWMGPTLIRSVPFDLQVEKCTGAL